MISNDVSLRDRFCDYRRFLMVPGTFNHRHYSW